VRKCKYYIRAFIRNRRDKVIGKKEEKQRVGEQIGEEVVEEKITYRRKTEDTEKCKEEEAKKGRNGSGVGLTMNFSRKMGSETTLSVPPAIRATACQERGENRRG
jgi:hypothetical protein